MTKRAAFSQADLERVLRALKAQGEAIGSIEYGDGTFRVLTREELKQQAPSPLAAWRAKRGERAA